MTTIRANVSAMFSEIDPYDVSNSIANLGESAGQITWRNALKIAENHEKWLESPLPDACDGMQEWAGSCGAWEAEEIAGWSDEECLAMFVQNIASELRDNLDSDAQDLDACVATYDTTDWDKESCYPTGSYYFDADSEGRRAVKVEFYTGM